MSRPPKQAVILAAGMGRRLSASTAHDRPKGFLEIGDQTLIQQSLGKLQRAGIGNVVIVTGHRRGWYESLAEMSNGLVTTVHNAEFDRSGSLYSLYCARDVIRGDFLLLESDLLYEQRALEVLLQGNMPDCILLSGLSQSHDEVFVETAAGKLIAMSKDRRDLKCLSGEFVGITRVSLALFERMLQWSGERLADNRNLDYETDCLVGIAADRAIPCQTVFDLAWAEIDDLDHLRRARDTVFPEIQQRDALGLMPDVAGGRL